MTLGELVATSRRHRERAAGSGGSGRRAARRLFSRALFDTPFDYEAFAARDGLIGHAGIVVFDDTVDMLQQARFAMEFCAVESCGKCTPCRIGLGARAEVIDRHWPGENIAANLHLVDDLCTTMKAGPFARSGVHPISRVERIGISRKILARRYARSR